MGSRDGKEVEWMALLSTREVMGKSNPYVPGLRAEDGEW